jgi:hypothetical protein
MKPTPAFCINGEKDGDETDLDCGGSCHGCSFGGDCAVNEDCLSLVCDAGTCNTAAPTATPTLNPTPATCVNTVHDGDETDVDCGGSCHGCGEDQTCFINEDCLSHICLDSKCNGSLSSAPTANPTNIGDTNRPTDSPTLSPTNLPTAFPSASPTKFPTASPTANPSTSPTSSCDATKAEFHEEVCIPNGSPFQQFGAGHADYHDLDNTKIELRHCVGNEWAFETIAVTAAEHADSKASTGTQMNAQDDSCHERDIQAFRFYDVVYTKISFCANGYLRFGSTSPLGPTENAAVFQSVRMIAAIWNDFNPAHDTETHRDLFHETVGHLEKFRWHMLAEHTEGGTNTFMVILDTSDSSIEIIHNQLSSGSGLVGVSNGAGSAHVPVDLAPNGQGGDHNIQNYCTGTGPPTEAPTANPTNLGDTNPPSFSPTA